MYSLAAGVDLYGQASAANCLAITIFGMELNGSTEDYKVLYQGYLPTSLASPIYTVPGSTVALIKTISVVNNGSATAAASSQTFQLFQAGSAAANALTPALPVVDIGSAYYEDGNGWSFAGSRGYLLSSAPFDLQDANYGIMGSFAETYDRNYISETNTAALSSGRLSMQAIWLNAGITVQRISFFSATTALGTGTNQLFGLYDNARALLATSASDGATAWSSNTIKTLAMTTPYTVTATGLYYAGIMVAATTVPTLKGSTALTGGQLHGAALILNGTADTGLSTSLPNPAAAISVTTTSIWAQVS